MPVLADAAAVVRLRHLGLSVRYTGPLYQPVSPSLLADPDTYYGGYHTSAGHEAHNRQVSTAHPDLAKLFTVVYILTHGGPFNSTQVLPTWAFAVGIDSGSLGAGAAISLFLFPLLVLVTILMLFFARRAQVS